MKIKRLGILIGVIAFSIYLVGGAMISFLAIRSSLDEAMTEHNSTVSTLVADIVSEPLKLGSFVEARVRIQSFINKGIFQCADLYYDGMPISKCENSDGLKSISTVLNISSENSNHNPVLITYINEGALRGVAFKKALGVVGFVFTFGLIFLLGIVALLRRIGTEILAVSDEILGAASGENQNSPIFEINFLKLKMKEYVSLKNSEIESQAMLKVSRQVAHDIRSPLSALEMTLVEVEMPDDRKAILKQVAARIRGIANDLLSQTRQRQTGAIKNFGLSHEESETVQVDLKPVEAVDLAKVVQDIVQENILAVGCVQLETSERLSQVRANAVDLGRIVSNLMNNSAEAAVSDRTLKVSIIFREYQNRIALTIQDNGRGISPENLSRVGECGFTRGKVSGNGLGVSFAKQKISEWGGSLQIFSKENEGTMVTLNFLKA